MLELCELWLIVECCGNVGYVKVKRHFTCAYPLDTQNSGTILLHVCDLVEFGGGTNLTAPGPEGRRCHSLKLSVNQGPANKDLPVASPILLAGVAGSTNRCQFLRPTIFDIRLRSAKRPCIGRACKGRRRRIEEQDDQAAVRPGSFGGQWRQPPSGFLQL